MSPRVSAGCLILLVAVLSSAPAHSAVRFQTSNFGKYVPRSAYRTAVVDFDLDGHLDLAISSPYPFGFITLMKGAGDGSFAPVDSLPMERDTGYAFEAADLDLDGNVDLVTNNYGATHVFRGLGGFAFAPEVLYSLAGEYAVDGQGLAIGDLFGDAHPEVVAPDTTGSLVVWQVSGAAVLTPAVRLPVTATVFALALRDLDHDGDLDLVDLEGESSQTPDWHARVYRNDGGGVFTSITTFAVSSVDGLELADSDGDGTIDLLAGPQIARGHGDCTFDAPLTYGNPGESFAHVADLDGDGHPDLVTSDLTGNQYPTNLRGFVRVRMGTTIGLGPARDWSAPWGPSYMEDADFNEDGRPDILTTGYVLGQVCFFAGDGRGGFVDPRHLATGGAAKDVQVADLDENGIVDVLAVVPALNLLKIFHGTGGAAFQAPTDVAVPAGAVACGVGDVDGDGHPDALVLASGSLSFYPGLGVAGLGAPTSSPLAGIGSSLRIGDVTGDGRPDVIVVTRSPSFVSVYPGTSGAGLGPRMDFALGITLNFSSFPRIGDVTGDGLPDLVTVIENEALYENGHPYVAAVLAGPVTAGSPLLKTTLFSTTLQGMGAELIDTDADGKQDVVVINGTTTTGNLFRCGADGTGHFTVDPPVFAGRMPTGMTSADFDGDGRRDIAVTNAYGAWASVSLLGANGKFGPAEGFGVGPVNDRASLLTAADLNGDGRPDLITAGDTTVTLLLQTGGTALDVPARAATVNGLAVARLWPTVANDHVRIRFALPRRAETTVELFDVAGRRFAHSTLGVLDAGPHEHVVSIPASVHSGVFWLRLSQGGESAAARGVIAR